MISGRVGGWIKPMNYDTIAPILVVRGLRIYTHGNQKYG